MLTPEQEKEFRDFIEAGDYLTNIQAKELLAEIDRLRVLNEEYRKEIREDIQLNEQYREAIKFSMEGFDRISRMADMFIQKKITEDMKYAELLEDFLEREK